MSSHDILYVGLFGACLLISAFFSSSETAFFSIQRVRLKYLVDNQVTGAKRVTKMIAQPAKLLSTILLGNNLVNVAAASIATTLAIKYLPEDQGVLIATISTTVILLVFSETLPKTIATQRAEKLSLTYARPLELISLVLTPFVIVLSWLASLLSKILGGSSIPKTLFSVDEIRTMITAGQQEGEVEAPEAKMLHRIFDFHDRSVREVMVPRLNIVAIEKGKTLSDFFSLYREFPRSRFPVYQGNTDNIVGILVAKDVFIAQAQRKVIEDSTIDTFLRPAYFTPETIHVNRLFNEMKETGNQLAIIVDEYGGTAGIVSLTGLAEEIVGEMGDELSTPDIEFEVLGENTFQLEGSVRIDEASDILGISLPQSEDYDTVAGLLLFLLGHIPTENEQVLHNNLRFKVLQTRGLRIEKIQITIEKRHDVSN